MIEDQVIHVFDLNLAILGFIRSKHNTRNIRWQHLSQRKYDPFCL